MSDNAAPAGEQHEADNWEDVRIAFGRVPRRNFCRIIYKPTGPFGMECSVRPYITHISKEWIYCPYCGLKIKGEHEMKSIEELCMIIEDIRNKTIDADDMANDEIITACREGMTPDEECIKIPKEWPDDPGPTKTLPDLYCNRSKCFNAELVEALMIAMPIVRRYAYDHPMWICNNVPHGNWTTVYVRQTR